MTELQVFMEFMWLLVTFDTSRGEGGGGFVYGNQGQEGKWTRPPLLNSFRWNHFQFYWQLAASWIILEVRWKFIFNPIKQVRTICFDLISRYDLGKLTCGPQANDQYSLSVNISFNLYEDLIWNYIFFSNSTFRVYIL